MRSNQLSFLPKIKLSHGGSERQGKRKTARPIDPKRPLHLVLRSSRAKGAWSFLHPNHVSPVESLARTIAIKWGIQIYRFANVGNHLHLIVQFKKREDFRSFLRELSGRIAMRVTGACKGSPVGKFWDTLAWSRVVEWGSDFRGVMNYLVKNLFESAGVYGPREKARGLRVISIRP